MICNDRVKCYGLPVNDDKTPAPQTGGLRIGDFAPDFEARSTIGPVRLTDYRDSWLILFSHPADFTPVCTTEFIELARQAEEFEKRGCSLMALSVDSLFAHFAWLRAIRDRFDVEVRFPIVEDPTLVIGRAFGMVAPTDNDSATIRTTYFIDPIGMVRATTCYPANMGRSVPEMLRMIDALQAIDANEALTPANWTPGEPLLRSPTHDLDEVFGGDDETAWFLREAENGART